MNWAYYTVPQTNADDREIEWPRGKGLGGTHLRRCPLDKQCF
jgi:choline dehydrogenase